MYLLLSHENDPVAAWLHQNLSPFLSSEIVWITDVHFSQSRRFELRLGDNINEARLVLPDGRRLDSNSADGVINRLCNAVGGSIAFLKEEDREYAWQEMAALTLSWLSAFRCPLLNPPAPNGFAGRTRSLVEWDCLAERAGLSVLERSWNSRTNNADQFTSSFMHAPPIQAGVPQANIFVYGSQAVLGEAVDDPELEIWKEASVSLSQLAEMPLLEIVFVKSYSGVWQFHHVNSMPDLRQAGFDGLSALRDLLSSTLSSNPEHIPVAL